MDVLLISPSSKSGDDKGSLREEALKLLPAEILEVDSIEDALIFVGCADEQTFDLAIVEADDRDAKQTTKFLQAARSMPCVLLSEEPAKLAQSLAALELSRVLIVDNQITALTAAIRAMIKKSVITVPETPDLHFVAVTPEALIRTVPLNVDVYIRLGKDKYVKLANQGDSFTAADAEHYTAKGNIDHFFLHHAQSAMLAKKQAERADNALANASPEAARSAAVETLEVVQEVVQKLGFTPEAQELAKKSAELTLKAIGATPSLKDVLKRIQRNQGKYITSHSVMLAEISCAVAHTVYWDSAGTFIKLAMAAMLHDLWIKDNRAAHVHDMAPEQVPHLSTREVHELRVHPIRVAEAARKLSKVPPDVDRIVLQHHERPDGTGFPRGLHDYQIDPLSACFIIAHDLLGFFLDHRDSTLADFVRVSNKTYTAGNFKKIMQEIKNRLES